MWRKELTLLLLTVSAVLTLGQNTVLLDNNETIPQEKKIIDSGSSLTLICNLKTEAYKRYRVNFSFTPRSFSNHSTIRHLSDNIFMRSESTSTDEENAKKYILRNATVEDSGSYLCSIKVEVPVVKEIFSNRTEIIVAENGPHTTYPPLTTTEVPSLAPRYPPLVDWWMWMLLAISAVILIVLLITCIMLRRKYHRRREAEPIYANTRPKQPSPRPETPVNTLKKASSSQNVQHQNRARRYDDGKRRHKP